MINLGKKFDKLERNVEGEYEKKGFSKKGAEYIGMATAGKIWREREAKRHSSHLKGLHCHFDGRA